MVFLEIEKLISKLKPESITQERKLVLQKLVDFIQSKVNIKQDVRLNFVCTHNSRRSHLSQIWAQVMANHFKVKNVFSYSSGTESTALFPMVVEILRNSGFSIQVLSETNNPVYSIKYAENELPIIAFSKTLNNDFNPKSEFAAILTCSQADEACPYVAGAEIRIPITYQDPKIFDNSPQQAEKYMERSLEIATELYFVFSQINLK